MIPATDPVARADLVAQAVLVAVGRLAVPVGLVAQAVLVVDGRLVVPVVRAGPVVVGLPVDPAARR